MKNPLHIGTAALYFDLSVSTTNADGHAALQLLPAGEFRAKDGRPTECAAWVCTAEIAAKLIQQIGTAANSLVVDYEHQTINATTNGQPAPAAGFFKQMEWREGQGLFATTVEWTAKAKQMIADGEYRYLSPVFSYDKNTGAVLQILHAALTNTPALDGMTQVALRNLMSTPLHEEPMNETLKQLLAVLGLTATTTEADAITAVTALKAKAEQVKLENATKDSEIAALKAQGSPGAPDPAKFVPIEAVSAIQQQLAALSLQVQTSDVSSVVSAALKEGRILPAQEAWATDLGKKDIASLRTYLANSTPIAALSGQQTKGQAPVGLTAAGDLNADQIAICKNMGITQEDFKKSLAV
ncbi:phage protease [soil metagenome]